MSYARKQLARGEEVVYDGGQHWFAVVVRVWWAIVLAVLSLAVLLWALSWDESPLRPIVQIAALIGWVVAFVKMGTAVWAWRNTEFLVTTRRLVRAEGILNKVVMDANLEKVNDAHLTQGLLGRILGYGDLDVMTAADEMGGVEDFPMLADPIDFKVAMLNQKELMDRPDLAPPPYQRQEQPTMRPAEPMPPRAGSDQVTVMDEPAAPSPAAPEAAAAAAAATAPTSDGATPGTPADDAAATLERLASLRDRGLITPEEYDAKKRELLERI
jgi:membrane protein YdbS with pleckstrin-like domain